MVANTSLVLVSGLATTGVGTSLVSPGDTDTGIDSEGEESMKATKSALLSPVFCADCGANRDLLWERLGTPDSPIAQAMIAATSICAACQKDMLSRLTRLTKGTGLSVTKMEAKMRRIIEMLDAQIAQREE